jgi:hypothetical protein
MHIKLSFMKVFKKRKVENHEKEDEEKQNKLKVY